MRTFRDRFDIPVSDEDLGSIPFYRPQADSPEVKYMLERRPALGGFVPERRTQKHIVLPPQKDYFADFWTPVERDVSTTMVFVQILRTLLKHPELGKQVVPI